MKTFLNPPFPVPLPGPEITVPELRDSMTILAQCETPEQQIVFILWKILGELQMKADVEKESA